MLASPQRRGNREWFTDPRSPDRRLQVTWHGDRRTTVLSIWHGDACAATFQLPVEESARLIGHLADALAHAATDNAPVAAAPSNPWTRLRARIERARARAEIVPFRRR